MPRKRPSAEQIVTKLRQIDVLVSQGRTIGQACREAEIAESGATRTPIPAQGGQHSGDCGQPVMAA
jgi:hypothetical protein